MRMTASLKYNGNDLCELGQRTTDSCGKMSLLHVASPWSRQIGLEGIA
jgi:hypothetical protein